jgi:hypothetical protein
MKLLDDLLPAALSLGSVLLLLAGEPSVFGTLIGGVGAIMMVFGTSRLFVKIRRLETRLDELARCDKLVRDGEM